VPLLVLVVALVAAPVLLVPLSLVLRYRAGTARRQARGWVAALNLIALALSTVLFLAGAALSNIWVPDTIEYALLGWLGGFALGIVGLWLSRWERGPASLHYTPNRWLVLALMLLVTGRILFGLWRAWHAWHHATGEAWTRSFGVAGSLAVGAVVLGYYLSYWMGIRRRLRIHARG